MDKFPDLPDLPAESPNVNRQPLSLFTRWLIGIACSLILLAGTGIYGASLYNNLLTRDELVDAAWSDVINMYRRRADLIPVVVDAVQAYTSHEHDLLAELGASRARILEGLESSAQDPKAFARLGQEQQLMTRSIGRLVALAERYPELKADSLYQGLIVELAGSENRISFARSRFIEAVKDYNLAVRHFPGNLLAQHFGFRTKPRFDDASAEIKTAPRMEPRA